VSIILLVLLKVSKVSEGLHALHSVQSTPQDSQPPLQTAHYKRTQTVGIEYVSLASVAKISIQHMPSVSAATSAQAIRFFERGKGYRLAEVASGCQGR
jgi:hypothetical protein